MTPRKPVATGGATMSSSTSASAAPCPARARIAGERVADPRRRPPKDRPRRHNPPRRILQPSGRNLATGAATDARSPSTNDDDPPPARVATPADFFDVRAATFHRTPPTSSRARARRASSGATRRSRRRCTRATSCWRRARDGVERAANPRRRPSWACAARGSSRGRFRSSRWRRIPPPGARASAGSSSARRAIGARRGMLFGSAQRPTRRRWAVREARVRGGGRRRGYYDDGEDAVCMRMTPRAVSARELTRLMAGLTREEARRPAPKTPEEKQRGTTMHPQDYPRDRPAFRRDGGGGARGGGGGGSGEGVGGSR